MLNTTIEAGSDLNNRIAKYLGFQTFKAYGVWFLSEPGTPVQDYSNHDALAHELLAPYRYAHEHSPDGDIVYRGFTDRVSINDYGQIIGEGMANTFALAACRAFVAMMERNAEIASED